MVKFQKKHLSDEELSRQHQFRFLYDHELNFDIIRHKYHDWNSPEQYKTWGQYKAKYSEEFSKPAPLAKVAAYVAAKDNRGPLFFSQLQEAAKDPKIIAIIQTLLAGGTDPRKILSLKRKFINADAAASGQLEPKAFKKIIRSTLKLPENSGDQPIE